MKAVSSLSEQGSAAPSPAKVDLRNLTLEELKGWAAQWGLEPYRGDQVFRWIFMPGVETFDQMTNIAKRWRDRLNEMATLSRLEIQATETSRDGTRKFLFGLEDGERIESVLIPEKGHYTLCISSQVGCAQQCRFCYTGRMGFRRDLKAAEIVNQVLAVRAALPAGDRPLTNVVLMGMGEPLANFENTLKALSILLSPQGLQLSPRHLTLSTAGLIPQMDLLGRSSPVNLAVSLNAADDATRDQLMPVNRRYPIPALIEACRRYPLSPRKRITFEYILIQGVNNSPASARLLSERLQGIKAKINLIPFNPHQGIDFRPPAEKHIAAFQDVLIQRHFTVMVRRSKGADISAACGQLHAHWTGEQRSRLQPE